MIKDEQPENGCAVCIETLGCKLNQAESEALARDLQRAGCRIVPPGTLTDVFVVNTCSVTHIADRKSRQLLRQARRLNPGALVVAMGCYAELATTSGDMPGSVDLVLGGGGSNSLIKLLRERGLLMAGAVAEPSRLRTRSLIKVQEGCNSACAYCVVPLARGHERSRPLPEIVAEVAARVAEGYREAVLTGTNVGRYASDGVDLTGLVQAILKQTSIAKLRLSSLQPQDLHQGLIDMWAAGGGRLCRHVHMPLQSGSDTALCRMGRGYNIDEFRQAADRLRQAVPDIAVTTDVMVGFPGESQAEFEESYAFCRDMGFASIHVFPYSRRRDTLAAAMPAQVADVVKAERERAMLELARDSARAFRRRFLGRTMDVLWEMPDKDGLNSGLTDNYIRVFARSQSDLWNRILSMELVGERDDGLWGEVVQV